MLPSSTFNPSSNFHKIDPENHISMGPTPSSLVESTVPSYISLSQRKFQVVSSLARYLSPGSASSTAGWITDYYFIRGSKIRS